MIISIKIKHQGKKECFTHNEHLAEEMFRIFPICGFC